MRWITLNFGTLHGPVGKKKWHCRYKRILDGKKIGMDSMVKEYGGVVRTWSSKEYSEKIILPDKLKFRWP